VSERTMIVSVAGFSPRMRSLSNCSPVADSGLPEKLLVVVSASPRLEADVTARTRMTIQAPRTRHGWRALARASRAGDRNDMVLSPLVSAFPIRSTDSILGFGRIGVVGQVDESGRGPVTDSTRGPMADGASPPNDGGRKQV